MRKVSELLGKPLVCLIEGTNEGIIKNITFDKRLRKPRCLILNDREDEGEFAVDFGSVFRFGEDAVVIKSRVELRREADAEQNNPINAGVFTAAGKFLGTIKDVFLDDKKNEVVSLLFTDETELAVGRVFSASGSAVIVTGEKETLKITPPKPRAAKKPVRKAIPPAAAREVRETGVTEEQVLAADAEWTPPKPEAQKKLIGDYNFLLGRKTNNDIFNKQNEKIIKRHTVITREIVERARAAGKLIELTVHSLPEQYIY